MTDIAIIEASTIYKRAAERLDANELQIFVKEFEAALDMARQRATDTRFLPAGWDSHFVSSAFDWSHTPQAEWNATAGGIGYWHHLHNAVHSHTRRPLPEFADGRTLFPSGFVDVGLIKYRYPHPIGPKNRLIPPKIPRVSDSASVQVA